MAGPQRSYPGGSGGGGEGGGGAPDPHAETHMTGGTDAIAVVNDSSNGLALSTDHVKLAGIDEEAVALANIPDVSSEDRGLMTVELFEKLDGIEEDATADLTGSEIAALLGGVDVVGNLGAVNSGTAARRMRFLVSTSGVISLQAAGDELRGSVFTNADYSGTEYVWLRVDDGTGSVYLAPILNVGSTVSPLGAHTLNGSTGVAVLGFKNSTSNVRVCGRTSTPGAPTTGTWAAGDSIQDSLGVWWECVTAGTPGVWASSAGTLAIRTITGTTDTSVLSDAGKLLMYTNSSAVTATVPPNSSVAYPVGTTIEDCQGGTGQVTLSPGSGVTLRSRNGLTTAGQWATMSRTKIDTNEWLITGDVTS